MQNLNTEITQFLQWFGQETLIPVEVRRDILGSIIKNKSITEPIALKITAILKILTERAQGNEAFLAAQNQWFDQEITFESNPETSSKESFIKQALERIENTKEDYISDVKANNENIRVKAEDMEEVQNQDTVANLKAAL